MLPFLRRIGNFDVAVPGLVYDLKSVVSSRNKMRMDFRLACLGRNERGQIFLLHQLPAENDIRAFKIAGALPALPESKRATRTHFSRGKRNRTRIFA